MPDSVHLSAFALAAVTVALIPGPGILYVLARSLAGGRAAGLRSSVGTGLGGLVHVVAAAAGLSALVAASATAFGALKVAGAAYLIWLGIRAIRGRDRRPAIAGAAGSADGAFRQGILTEVLNPKTALFFLTFLPQFCQPDRGPLILQLVVLGVVSVTLNTLVDVVVAFGAGGIGERLRRRPELWRRQQVVTGGILIFLGLTTLVTGRRAVT
jgi:threonine/homoserine/homoserine lactone efflux protein